MLSLRSTNDVLQALDAARQIHIEAYTLHGPVLHAVEAAARRGATVGVALEGRPYSDSPGRLTAENQRLARELRAAGAVVTLGHPFHAKAIVADGTLYLDEKNWDMGDLVLRDDDPVEARSIPMNKRDALDQEAALLKGARICDGAIVESESFGSYNTVFKNLKDLGASGAAPRLLVSDRQLRHNPAERSALDELVSEGVDVRVCSDSEKLAVAGNRAWLGSANATSPFGRGAMTDWGLQTNDATIVAAVRDRLETTWATARPLPRH